MRTMVPAFLVMLLATSSFAQERTWTQQFPEKSLTARSFHAMAYDAARAEVIVFGGVGSSGSFLGDTWVWDGSRWSERSPGLAPSARHRHNMAYDGARGQIVLFGGVDEKDGVRDDTWIWDGTSWTQKTPLTRPPARFGHVMAYDSARGQIVLFGGSTTREMLSDTWVWDGITWTQKSPGANPGPRAFHSLTFGTQSSNVVLFGGLKPDGLASAETWTWDGDAWTQKSPANSPPARAWAAAALDQTNSVVLFGGSTPTMTGVPLGDTWIWDGTNWVEAHTTLVPARMFHAMAYDSTRQQSILVSGVGDGDSTNDVRGNVLQGVALNDTWVWGKPGMRPPSPFMISIRGGISWMTSGGSGSAVAGYARIQANAGSTTPSGLAIFGFRQNDILVTEAAVPASKLIQSGRIFAEVNGPVNTGLAIANPNSQPANISFSLTDTNGQNFGQGNTIIPASGQVAAFLDQSPFKSDPSFTGTFSFNSDVPVAAVALHAFTNERSEFLITTLPIAAFTATTSETIVFPHFVDGGGWTTQIALVNPTDETISGTVQFLGQGTANAAAQPVIVTVNNQGNSTFSYSIPARSSRRLQTSGLAAAVRVGSVRVTPTANTKTPSGLCIFSFRSGGVTVSQTGVSASRARSSFRLYAQASGTPGTTNSIQTGIAIANPSTAAATVNFELTTLTGMFTGLSGTASVPGNGQIAMFLNQIPGFANLQVPFQGVLRIWTDSESGVSVAGLRGRYNERGDFLIATTDPIDESSTSSGELLFPHLVDAGGYTTQFILLNGSSQVSSGVVRFFSQTGQPLDLSFQ